MLDFILRRSRKRPERAPVERVDCRYDPVFDALFARDFHAVQTRRLQERLVRLRPRIAEEDFAFPDKPDELFGEVGVRFCEIQITAMRERSRLRRDRLDPARVCVSETVDRDSRAEVQIFAPVCAS